MGIGEAGSHVPSAPVQVGQLQVGQLQVGPVQVGQLPVGNGSPSPVGLGCRLWVWPETIGGRAVLMVGLVGTVSFTDPLIATTVAVLREVLRRCAGADPVYVVAPGGQLPVEVRGLRVDTALVSALLDRAASWAERRPVAPSSDAPGWYQEEVPVATEQAHDERSR